MNKKLLLFIFGAIGGFILVLTFMGFTKNSQNTAQQPAQGILTPAEGNSASAKIVDKDITKELFPKTILDLQLVQIIEGEQAKQQISQLHGTDIPMDDAFVVQYKKDVTDTVTIWVSEYAEDDAAKKSVALMHEKIDASPVFQNHQNMVINGIEYHYVTGMGQSHYFYYRGNDAIWIGIGSQSEKDILSTVIKTL